MQKFNPLLQWFADQTKNPGRWNHYNYSVSVSVGKAAGSTAMCSIQLDTFPYILLGLSGKIIGNTAEPATSGVYQDGQWSIEWKDSKRNFSKGYIPADLLFGNTANGFYRDLTYPVAFDGGQTITFNIRNDVTRPLPGPQETFTVALVTFGIGDFGV